VSVSQEKFETWSESILPVLLSIRESLEDKSEEQSAAIDVDGLQRELVARFRESLDEVRTHLLTLEDSQRYSASWDLAKRGEILVAQLEINTSVQELHKSTRALLDILQEDRNGEHGSEKVSSIPWHFILGIGQIVGSGLASRLGALTVTSYQAPFREYKQESLVESRNFVPDNFIASNYEGVWKNAYPHTHEETFMRCLDGTKVEVSTGLCCRTPSSTY
jgi:hypothetical protein